jgi:hypothetical protein
MILWRCLAFQASLGPCDVLSALPKTAKGEREERKDEELRETYMTGNLAWISP